ncbi:nucleoside deaminase [Bacillaceae bacterium Marseille-Q3522]|nr:nucleoside deaminase [Bacillaceae bacterium Marseille-Q3522]
MKPIIVSRDEEEIHLNNDQHRVFLNHALKIAAENVKLSGGGPFGAVIVKDGKIIAEGVNKVTVICDPTAHAEVSAIREACNVLQTFDLSGCTLYTSCEPCPMCFGAIYWAKLDDVYFAASRKDAANVDFADDFIYDEVSLAIEQRTKPFTQIKMDNRLEPFRLWHTKSDKTPY